MEAMSDFDQANNAEFLDYLKDQNPSNETRKFIAKETERMIDVYTNNLNMVFKICLEKANLNTAFAQEQTINQENLVPINISATPANGKRSVRSSNVKNGIAPSTTNSKASTNGIFLRKHDINNDLCQDLVEKATLSNDCQEKEAIPSGKVRVQIISSSPQTNPSPHDGEIRLVEPKSNASRLCKIGRSTGKEYNEHGVSLHNDAEVSMKHGLLTRKKIKKGYEYYFKDGRSRNGTYDVETGNKLEPDIEYKLINGMQLLLGRSILQFNFST